MALKNVNIPLNIKDFPSSTAVSNCAYIGENNEIANANNILIIGNNINWKGHGGPQSNTLVVGENLTSQSGAFDDYKNQVVIGEFNEPSTTQGSYLVVGDGTGKNELAHNILVVKRGQVNINGLLNIAGTGVNITGAATITGNTAINGLLTIGDEDSGVTTIGTDEINTSSLKANSIEANSETSISIKSPVNLNNNTISGGATLKGTYTFDAINGLKIGNTIINTSNQPTTLTMPSREGTLALNTEYYLYTITLCFYKEDGATADRGIFTFTGVANSQLDSLITDDGEKSYSTITEPQLQQIYNKFFHNGASIHFTASGELRHRENASRGVSSYNITAINYIYNEINGRPYYSCTISYIPLYTSSDQYVKSFTLYTNSGGAGVAYIDSNNIQNVTISKKTIRSGGGVIVNN